MSHESPVWFVFRVATLHAVTHAKCIRCADYKSRPFWPAPDLCAFALPNGPGLVIRQSLSEDTSHGCEEGLEAVYDVNEFPLVKNREDAIWMLLAQNCEYVHIESDGAVGHVPFFISSEGVSIPQCWSLHVEFIATDLRDNPDVICYIEHEKQKPKLDKWNDLSALSLPSHPIEYPTNCWLPGTFVSDTRTTACVYRIHDSVSGLIELFVADNSVTPRAGATIMRRSTQSTGEIVTRDIATAL